MSVIDRVGLHAASISLISEELQADIAKIEAMNDGKGATEMQALIAYLQQLGTHLK